MFEVFESIKILSLASKKRGQVDITRECISTSIASEKSKEKKERLSMFNTRRLNCTMAITTAQDWRQEIYVN